MTDTARTWAEDTLRKIETKADLMQDRARELDFIPYTASHGQWVPGPFDGLAWWTNGFYPAFFWQLFAATGSSAWSKEALRAQALLDQAFQDFPHLHHDVGFMWRISTGFQYDLTGAKEARETTLYAAHLLLGRYNPNGFFRAWNEDKAGWAIIDCMMNLSILYWASRETGDPRFQLAAARHAETARQYFIRENGSSEHIVIFDPLTGAVMDKPGGQGYAPGSEWTRGQGWATYGFSLAARHLGRADFLETAKRVADHAISRLGEKRLCEVDFLAPASPVIYDDCATAILACGMLDIAEQLHGGEEAARYEDFASQMLMALDAHADWSGNTPNILTRCTGSYHTKDHEIPMIYGDYFFLEGVLRLSGKERCRW
ncbi:MAG: glycoside hydrolase family 88 protein [Clostridia bacterium]|nr:glycoside hydrolase family 88 protein [Clostridia bacterium]